MLVDKRLEQLATAIDAHPVDADTALMEVENMADKQRTRHGILLTVAAAAVVVAGLVWGPGLLDSLGGESDPMPAGPAEDPAAVLAAYQDVRNVNTTVEVDPQEWLDSLMSFYAEDAVVIGHPFDTNDPPIATGPDEIARLEAQVAPANSDADPGQRRHYATEYVDVRVSGNKATFRTHFFDKYGECLGAGGTDQITVEDSTITAYDWADGSNEPCDPEQVGQTYVDAVAVEFTGDSCVYSGPTEFSVGDRLDIVAVDATEQRHNVGYAIEPADADEESGTYLWSKTTQPGTDRYMAFTLDAPGAWRLYCFLPQEGRQVDATIVEVAE
jgi:hypothetical protein